MASMRVKQAVMSKTDGHCWYCGMELVIYDATKGMKINLPNELTLDHILPRTRGGSHHVSNLLPCCRSCNSTKSDMTVEEYRRYLARRKRNIPHFSQEQIDYLLSYGITIPKPPAPLSLFWSELEGYSVFPMELYVKKKDNQT